MATADELLASLSNSDDDKTLIIDNYLRNINIPNGIKSLGVESDDEVLRLKFKMPRYLGGTDLSTFAIRINYLNARGEGDVYTVSDMKVVDDDITFSWLVGPNATKYKGSTKFNVCMKIVDDDGHVQKEYNTTIATLPVLEGLETDEGLIEAHTDILEQWRNQLFGMAPAKVDDLFLDPDTGTLYLMSNGELIGDGVIVSTGGSGGGSENNAIITLQNTTGWSYKNISQSSECKLSFAWTSTEDGVATGDGSVSVKVGGVLRYGSAVKQGPVEIDVASYLSVGSNSVRVSVSDVYGNSRTIAFTINVVSLTLTSSFDPLIAYTGSISFPYVPTGAVEKTVRFVLDGVEIGHTVTSVSGRQQTYIIPAQKHGSHTLFVYFDAEIDGEVVSSNGMFYDIICVEEDDMTPIIASTFRNLEVEQYATFTIPYQVYVPQNLNATISLSVNEGAATTLTVDRTLQTWSYRPNDAGDLTMTITCVGANGATVTKEFKMVVVESKIDVDVTTDDMALYLTSYGRSNNEENPGVWKSGDIDVQFEDFNFKTDGWQLDDDGVTVMRVTGDARLTIPYKIFANDFRTTGKTIELEFATRDVLNYDAVLLSCMSGGRGIQVTTQRATLMSEQSTIGTQYKEEEHVRLSFVIEKKSSTKLLLCYINGILSGSVVYPDDDDFSQASPVDITIGNSECTTDIYNIRVYDNDLTRHQILENWIGDTQLGSERKARYERNNVYDDYSAITPETLKRDLPYLVIVCPVLPTFKGDKKTCSGYYIDPIDQSKSFSFEGAEIDVQGTSSQYYFIKNFKIKFKGGFVFDDDVTSETYQLNDAVIPTDTYTFKADVASSEGANNVVLAKIYNDLCPVKTPPQEKDPRVRQTIDGHPIAIFWDNGSGIKFYGKFNFNHDKGTEEVFGFTPGDESWEIRQNGTERTGFRSADFTGSDWENDFEARYPDKNKNIVNLQAFAEWLVSTNVDQATNAALPGAVTYGEVTYNTDSPEYRLAKFKAELKDHADVDAMVFYYVITELFLCIDQREKNAFPTLWKDDPNHWMMLFYDADSSLGIDNKGNLAFDYYLEDIDYTEAGDPVFNGQASTLWVNLRNCFYAEIEAEYKRLRTTVRNDGSGLPLISYDVVNNMFEAHQSKWSEAIYNEDGYHKSIEPYALNGDTLYLPMLQGKKEQQRKWWLYNRFRYLDSKYNTGSSMSTRITLRAHAQGNIKLKAYVNMYGHVYYNAEMAEHRMYRGQEYEFVWAATGAEDAVIGINDADMLTSLGDLSPLMVELIDISKATHLTSLKIGDASENYVNNNLNSITLGNNVLLKSMDFRNCASLTQAVDASGCTGLEEAYFDGTAITSLSLPNGGNLKTLHLPGTVTNLTIRNQSKLEDFTMPNYANISTVWLENNSSAVDAIGILNAIPANSRVRMLGVNFGEATVEEAMALCDRLDSMRGLDENGNNVDVAQVSGTIYIPSLTGEELYRFQNRYPNIAVIYNQLTLYTVRFFNGDTLMQTVNDVMYGAAVEYDGDRPIKSGETDESRWSFTGWDPEPTFVTGNMDCYAQYEYHGLYARELVQRTIEGDYENDRVTSVGDYAFYEATKLTSVSMPEVTSIGASAFSATNIDVANFPKALNVGQQAFDGCRSLRVAIIPSVTTLYGCNQTFKNCINLTNVDISEVVCFGGGNFMGCTKLIEVVLPKFNGILYDYVFQDCAALQKVDFGGPAHFDRGNVFKNCTSLEVVVLRSDIVSRLSKIDNFSDSAVSSGTGYIYVPRALVDTYKTATNWSTYATQFRAIEDYPEICGGEV